MALFFPPPLFDPPIDLKTPFFPLQFSLPPSHSAIKMEKIWERQGWLEGDGREGRGEKRGKPAAEIYNYIVNGRGRELAIGNSPHKTMICTIGKIRRLLLGRFF